MGQDKATIRIGASTLIGHTYAVAKTVFAEIMVVSSLHKPLKASRRGWFTTCCLYPES